MLPWAQFARMPAALSMLYTMAVPALCRAEAHGLDVNHVLHICCSCSCSMTRIASSDTNLADGLGSNSSGSTFVHHCMCSCIWMSDVTDSLAVTRSPRPGRSVSFLQCGRCPPSSQKLCPRGDTHAVNPPSNPCASDLIRLVQTRTHCKDLVRADRNNMGMQHRRLGDDRCLIQHALPAQLYSM